MHLQSWQLTRSGETIEVRSSVTTISKPVCAGKDFVFELMADIYNEIAELFPYRHIHIGGDEVNQKAWKQCPHCQKRMIVGGLKRTELQAYFEKQLVDKINSGGSRAIGWSEIVHYGLDEKFINQYWIFTTRKKTIATLKNGRKSFNS